MKMVGATGIPPPLRTPHNLPRDECVGMTKW